ncbi:hypothetical protein CEXT_492551 [Caerostris extrusa]|uniref:Uncharacterized protein n=1 Tax=Caerostris extrusa TaxID=172846 RepID=A0AAV4X4A5_CAEEX|nr:hypothetical protein CEXT_492551 [Caerostris extrusa]
MGVQAVWATKKNRWTVKTGIMAKKEELLSCRQKNNTGDIAGDEAKKKKGGSFGDKEEPADRENGNYGEEGNLLSCRQKNTTGDFTRDGGWGWRKKKGGSFSVLPVIFSRQASCRADISLGMRVTNELFAVKTTRTI